MDLRLKPQDVVLALKLVAVLGDAWNQPEIASSLHLSASEVNHGLKRLAACSLYNVNERRVIKASLHEFLVSGLRYVFPAQLGPLGKGMPTAFSVAPFSKKLRLGDDDGVVWLASGKSAQARGRVIEPLYPTVPEAAADDPLLHEYLALADTLRVGRARERSMARDELARRLES